MTPTDYTDEISAALNALTAAIAVSISWPVLYQWAGSNPLAVEHYAQLLGLWRQVWQGGNQGTPVPTVFLYHGTAKITNMRENALVALPALALNYIAMTVSVFKR